MTMTKTDYITIRVPPLLRKELQKRAAAEMRTMASLIQYVLTRWLEGRT